MARKAPGGQQVTTGVLVGEAHVLARSSAAKTNPQKRNILSVKPGSLLGDLAILANVSLQTVKLDWP